MKTIITVALWIVVTKIFLIIAKKIFPEDF